jgi:hypothetical protein
MRYRKFAWTAALCSALLASILAAACGNLLSDPPSTRSDVGFRLDVRERGIWLVGGLSGGAMSTAIGAVDLYDPVENEWYPSVTSIPTPVSFAGYAALGGKLYVIGGFDAAGNVMSAVQIYTVSADSWDTDAAHPLPTARANISATALDGKIYVLSGTSANYNINWAAAGICYEFTPGSGWVTKSAYSTTANSERFSYGYGSVLYGIGGRNAAATVAGLAHEGIVPWTSAAGTLTSATEVAMATPRTGVAGVLYDAPDGTVDSVVLFGGFSALSNVTGCFINYNSAAPIPSGTSSSLVQYLATPFSTTTVAWSANAASGYPALAFGAAVVSRALASDRIYHFGGTASLGTTPGVVSSTFWIAPPAPPATWSDIVSSAAAMPRVRWGHGALTLD